MRFLLLLCLTLGTARAEIPLELLAEFQLPPGTGAWDVQHWMDDSTFGWVAAVGETLQYETRLGEGVQTLGFSNTLCDEFIEHEPFVIDKVALAKHEDGIPSFVFVYRYFSLDGITYIAHLYGSDVYCEAANWGGNYTCLSSGDVHDLFVSPRLPEVSRFYGYCLSYYQYCDPAGSNSSYSNSTASFVPLQEPLSTISVSPASSIAAYPNSELDVAVVGHRQYRRIDDSYPYRGDVVSDFSVFASVTQTGVAVDTVCYRTYEVGEDVVPPCEIAYNEFVRPITAAVNRYRQKRIIQDGHFYSGDTHALLFSAYIPCKLHVVCYDGEERQSLICQQGNRLVSYSLENGTPVDSSQVFRGELRGAIGSGPCPNKIVTEEIADGTRTIRIFRIQSHQTDEDRVEIPISFITVAYPNPFNSSVTVEFALSKDQEISLDIFDLTGRYETTVFAGRMQQGQHVRDWTPNGQASGIYFARLVGADVASTTKLLYLK